MRYIIIEAYKIKNNRTKTMDNSLNELIDNIVAYIIKTETETNPETETETET